MDPYGLTEADLPLRSKQMHLRDVAFQLYWEGPYSAITDMYADAAHRAGATLSEIQNVREYCRQHPICIDSSFDDVVEAASRVPLH